jgi:hypothetical protein
MCSKCADIENKIAHYRRMAIHVPDELTLEGIAVLLRAMTVEKAALHPVMDSTLSGI